MTDTVQLTPAQLVEKWRDEVENTVAWDDYTEGIHDAMRACAEELERSLDTEAEA